MCEYIAECLSVLFKSEKVCCDCENAHLHPNTQAVQPLRNRERVQDQPDRQTTTLAAGMHDIHMHTYTIRMRTRPSAYYKTTALTVGAYAVDEYTTR